MVNHCANPQCCKPLHYLREGRIFVFDSPDPLASAKDGKVVRRMEHFWLCGACSDAYTLEQNHDKIVGICPKPTRHYRSPVTILPTAVAS